MAIEYLLKLVDSINAKDRELKYTEALKKVIPYCKDQLLKNEIPYIINMHDGSLFPGFIFMSWNCIEPKSNMLIGLKRLKFLYYLISGLVHIDTYMGCPPLGRLSSFHYDMIQDAYNDLMQNEPEEFGRLPIYVIILYQSIPRYTYDGKNGLNRIYGKDFSMLYHGFYKPNNDADIHQLLKLRILHDYR